MTLSVSGLRVTYGGVVAVRDVTLSVAPGELLAVLGANGAGKTSTLLAVSGLVPVRAGDVSLDGVSLVGRSAEAVARLGIAHVPAGRGLFPGLSVADNLKMGLYGAGRLGASVDDVVDRFPILRERWNQAAGTMSGGQQQQLAIARALVQQPKVLLLDEMSMGLAPLVTQELFALVAELRDSGMAVVVVEQFVGQALAVADRAVVLELGHGVASGTPAVRSGADLAAAYLGGGHAAPTVSREAPSRARERVGVTLRGAEVRRLEERAAAEGRTVDEVVEDIVRGSL